MRWFIGHFGVLEELRARCLSQAGEIIWLREHLDQQRERTDRLTEALARKANIDLILPLSEPPPPERVYVPNPWKDPNPVTDKFPMEKASVGVNVSTSTPTFQKEKTQ